MDYKKNGKLLSQETDITDIGIFDETRKSINSALYERVSSPLYGTLIISWLVWNWEIVYLTFFVNESRIEMTKSTT
ncbi:MAG: hypothetical protein GY816_23665 [Cytophagales bacterium]|nr:hypothetical protein [Cytophagales bacterium]